MAFISGFIVFSLIIAFAYLIGFLMLLTDNKENGCEMTYMYQYPQFVRIHVKADQQFRKYGLYVYSEGRFTQNARNMKFSGIPILFIPGNAGSYRQVRSFASISLRKSIEQRPGFHFDFFTVDLNDEFSGLNGALLYEQTQYVNHTINRILELYSSYGNHNKNLILLGHSMGGVIARGILNSVYDKTVLPLIITLAAPHARPPLMLDTYISDYYDHLQKTATESNNTIIAISGGYSDYIVSPFLSLSRGTEHLNVISPSIPLVWLPVDHLCILWCKQLVLVTTRALFDLVDLSTGKISKDTKYHQAVFQHHLINNNGLKMRKISQYSQSTVFSKGRSEWIENLQKHYTISLRKGVRLVQWHMIRLLNEADYRYLKVVAINLKVTDWIFACPATHVQDQHRICNEGVHLSHLSEIAPSINKKRRTLYIDTHELKRNYTDLTHIVIKVLPTSESIVVHVDRFLGDDRKIQVTLPSWWSFKRDVIINETLERVVHYDLLVHQLHHIVQSYKLYIEPIKCNSNTHHATASLIVPWGNQNVHQHIMEGDRTFFRIRLHQSRPLGWNDSFPSILVNLDPACRYSISIKNDIFGVFGQIVRSYSPLLLANIVAIILLTLRNQMVDIQKSGSCSSFFTAIQHGIKPYYILPLVKISSRILSWKGFSKILPLPDWHVITEEGNDFLLLSVVLYVTAVGVVWLAALGIAASLIFCESTFHKFTAKFLARILTGSLKLSDWLIGGLHKLPEIVATLLVILSITTCGGLSLCLGCIFYFLKLTQMSQDYVERIVLKFLKYFGKKFKRSTPPSAETGLNEPESSQDVVESSDVEDEVVDKEYLQVDKKELTGEDLNKQEHLEAVEELNIENVPDEDESDNDVKEEKEQDKVAVLSTNEELDCDGIFFHFTIFILWCIVAALNVPSVLTWAHNFKYNSTLQPDASFIPGLILSLCALPLWHMDLPKRNICGYGQVAQLLNIMVGVSLIYTSLCLYRLNYIITLAIALVTLHQLFFWNRTTVEEETIPDTRSTETLYSDIKSKCE